MSRTVPTIAILVTVLVAGLPSLAPAQGTGVAQVQVAPPNVSLNIGQHANVFATAFDGKNNVVPIQKITWSSSNPAVLKVEADSTSPEIAILVGLAAGAATVEARVGTRRGTATVQVAGAGPVSVAAAVPSGPPAPTGFGAASLLKLEPSSLFLLPAEAFRVSPVFLKDDGTPAAPARLSWKSLVPTVATVDAEGTVVAIAPGQGLIEATAGPLAGRLPVAVSLSKIALSRRLQTMSPGSVDTFVVTVPEQNNRPLPPTNIQWRSSDENVVRVSPFGVVSAVAGGRAEVVASGFLQELRVPVSVHKAVEFLRLSPSARDTIRLPLGGSVRFVAEAQAADQSPVPEAPISWKLLDTSVVSFDSSSGLMLPKRIGTTRLRISVAGGGLDTAWTVSVIAGGVRFPLHRAGLATGDRLKVTASLTDDAGRPIAAATGLRWTSSAAQVAQVDLDGNVAGAAPGRSTIVALSPWGRGDTLTVIVQRELLVTATRGGNPDIYALDRRSPDPAGWTRVTTEPSNESGASFAAGGMELVFMSSRDGNQEIYVADADGTNPRRLTSTPAQEDSPDWTPDGKQIVYASNATGSYQIWIMNADGTEQRRLTDGPAFNFQPAVSPDGKTIAFASTRDGNYDIYLMNIDGTSQRNYTHSPGRETIPQWFPNGQLGYLTEQRTGTGRNASIASVVMKADPAGGAPATALTPANLVVTDFAVSRDGESLALVVSSSGPGGAMSSKLYLTSAATGSVPVEVPVPAAGEQVFSPAFRK
ncbi:MAG: PD40 domain-containing protein [Gemmatimonadetes bacterium]|nr:PD40 domain-containing protein [Gemmatimonadota bacterium]